MYYAYFGVKLGDQEKSWAPHKVFSAFVEELWQWLKGMKMSFHFGVPMIWREPQNHSIDCYFHSYNVQGFNLKKKNEIFHLNLSATCPVPRGLWIPVPFMSKGTTRHTRPTFLPFFLVLFHSTVWDIPSWCWGLVPPQLEMSFFDPSSLLAFLGFCILSGPYMWKGGSLGFPLPPVRKGILVIPFRPPFHLYEITRIPFSTCTTSP